MELAFAAPPLLVRLAAGLHPSGLAWVLRSRITSGHAVESKILLSSMLAHSNRAPRTLARAVEARRGAESVWWSVARAEGGGPGGV